MSITKNNISDLIRDIKSGGDPTMEGKLHPTIIWKVTDTVFGGLIEQALYKDRDSNGYDINGDWLSTFKNVPVLIDNDTNQKYSELPDQVISLKQNRGIHRVSEMKSLDNAFVQVANGSDDVFRILETHWINLKTEYYLEGNRIYYRNMGNAVKEVLIKMISGISNLDADSPIPIPASKEEELIKRVILILEEEKLVPQDKLNNENTNKYHS